MNYIVLSAKKAGYPHRKYGYVIKIGSPLVDLTLNNKFEEWYPNKQRAQVVADYLNKNKK